MKGVQKIVCDRQWGNGAGGVFHSKNSLFNASENEENNPFSVLRMPFYSLRVLTPVTALGADRGNRGRVCCLFYGIGNAGKTKKYAGFLLHFCCTFVADRFAGSACAYNHFRAMPLCTFFESVFYPIKRKNPVRMAAYGHRVSMRRD